MGVGARQAIRRPRARGRVLLPPSLVVEVVLVQQLVRRASIRNRLRHRRSCPAPYSSAAHSSCASPTPRACCSGMRVGLRHMTVRRAGRRALRLAPSLPRARAGAGASRRARARWVPLDLARHPHRATSRQRKWAHLEAVPRCGAHLTRLGRASVGNRTCRNDPGSVDRTREARTAVSRNRARGDVTRESQSGYARARCEFLVQV
ncbi:hypothetical protein B0H14DRAFT_1701901 [Mycena olivaceomarginata]|nr:hypothetical protein B0H14DRAFT_1701901 [Mycena olivaceomarginata]